MDGPIAMYCHMDHKLWYNRLWTIAYGLYNITEFQDQAATYTEGMEGSVRVMSVSLIFRHPVYLKL